MAAAYYDAHVRNGNFIAPPTGNLGSCGQTPSAMIGASYQLPSTGQQLSSYPLSSYQSYVSPPIQLNKVELNGGNGLLPSSNINSCYQLPSAGNYQLPSAGNVAGIGFPSYAPSGSTSKSQYTVKQDVEIYSESSKGWVSGVVTKISDNGTATISYKGNQKLVPVEHQQTHLRPAASRGNQPRTSSGLPVNQTLNFNSNTPKFEFYPGNVLPVGSEVEYYSTTHCGWVQAKVLRVRPNGNYDLDCKSDVPPEKVRPDDPLRQGGAFDCSPPKKGAPAYDKFGPPPPEQVGTFQFDLSALCGQNPPGGHGVDVPPPFSNYADEENYGAPETFYSDDDAFQRQPSLIIDLAQAVKDVEEGQYGNGPRRVETEYLQW
jgi:hypothetical protein